MLTVFTPRSLTLVAVVCRICRICCCVCCVQCICRRLINATSKLVIVRIKSLSWQQRDQISCEKLLYYIYIEHTYTQYICKHPFLYNCVQLEYLAAATNACRSKGMNNSYSLLAISVHTLRIRRVGSAHNHPVDWIESNCLCFIAASHVPHCARHQSQIVINEVVYRPNPYQPSGRRL